MESGKKESISATWNVPAYYRLFIGHLVPGDVKTTA